MARHDWSRWDDHLRNGWIVRGKSVISYNNGSLQTNSRAQLHFFLFRSPYHDC